MFPTKKELIELIKNDQTTAFDSEDSDLDLEDEEDVDPMDMMIIEELVYPFGVTLEMVKQYRDIPFLNATENINPILHKLIRSLKFWRQEIPQWLKDRVEENKK